MAQTINTALRAYGSTRTAADVRYMSNASNPRIFVDCGPLGAVFADDLDRMRVGAEQPESSERACFAWWPVMLDGEVVGELRDDATGIAFFDAEEAA